MVLHWLLVINLSVFATKLAAFVSCPWLRNVYDYAVSDLKPLQSLQSRSDAQPCAALRFPQVCREVLSEVGKFLEPLPHQPLLSASASFCALLELQMQPRLPSFSS